MLCLKCHAAASTAVLLSGMASTHANNDVSCFDCLQLHKGTQRKMNRHEQEQTCFGCLQEPVALPMAESHLDGLATAVSGSTNSLCNRA
jgi:hypothetical protein